MISHGDLDHKNGLWDASGKPTIIDWESAIKLDPTPVGAAMGRRFARKQTAWASRLNTVTMQPARGCTTDSMRRKQQFS
ncbi:MAG: hypothetical protein DRQ97_02350 [Gammaproteobacteria bacterium]|nr:MAG: hypothetical protein DRQ97_02350 [Gammaproteobacteria bacterium]